MPEIVSLRVTQAVGKITNFLQRRDTPVTTACAALLAAAAAVAHKIFIPCKIKRIGEGQQIFACPPAQQEH